MNIFLLNGTPIQLILAQEAKHVLGISDEDSILAIRNIANDTYKLSIKTREEVLEFSSWKEIHFIPQIKFKNFLEYIKNFRQYISVARNLIESNQPVKNIFLGNYGNEPMRHIANTYAARGCAIYFLDEGNGTLHLYQRREEAGGNLREQKLKDKLRNALSDFFKVSLLGLKVYDVKYPVTFFTEYPLEPTPRTHILRHRFETIRKHTNDWKRDDRVYFFGNAFIDFRHLVKEDYFSFFSFITEYFKGERILYVPHPRERQDEVEEMAKKFSLEVLTTSLAIEIYLVKNKILPKYVGGFTSTSLSRVHQMLGPAVPVVSFRVPSRLLRVRKKIVENLYAYFSKELVSDTFKIVDINLQDYENT
jgi:hypothetical protein